MRPQLILELVPLCIAAVSAVDTLGANTIELMASGGSKQILIFLALGRASAGACLVVKLGDNRLTSDAGRYAKACKLVWILKPCLS